MFRLFRPIRAHVQNPNFYARISHLHKKPNSKYTPLSNPAIDFLLNEATHELQSSDEPAYPGPPGRHCPSVQNEEEEGSFGGKVQVSHPWPEWVALVNKLVEVGYFVQIGYPFESHKTGPKEFNQIRTAFLNFARDRYDIIRLLSLKDIQIISGPGCPSLDRKVVNSGKRLRAHVGLDEGSVCSSCILRGDCERAFIKAREDEGGRTVDVMRFILALGFDAVTDSKENKACLTGKVKDSVKVLLKQIVELSTEKPDTEHPTASTSGRISSTLEKTAQQVKSQIDVPMKQGDWRCPECSFVNFAKNVKCLRCNGLFQERLQKLAEDHDQMPLKKGDWICNKCNFLNFAKNSWCLQCKEKPPKRELNGGEWECESCNYINFKRNMVCLRCDHKRPKALNSSPLQPKSANGSMLHRQPRPFFGQEKQCRDEGLGELNFVENRGQHNSYSRDSKSGFIDFPVLGGKIDLSRNAQRQEKWRLETAKQNRSVARAKENADLFESSFIRDSGHFEFTQDEEMAEWFDPKPKQNGDPRPDDDYHTC